MSDMSPEKLSEMADTIRNVLKDFEMDFDMFNVKIRVTKEYYDSIKDNFPNRHPLDIIVGAGEGDWGIDILYSPGQSKMESMRRN